MIVTSNPGAVVGINPSAGNQATVRNDWCWNPLPEKWTFLYCSFYVLQLIADDYFLMDSFCIKRWNFLYVVDSTLNFF
jgi:hypothetical protein